MKRSQDPVDRAVRLFKSWQGHLRHAEFYARAVNKAVQEIPANRMAEYVERTSEPMTYKSLSQS